MSKSRRTLSTQGSSTSSTSHFGAPPSYKRAALLPSQPFTFPSIPEARNTANNTFDVTSSTTSAHRIPMPSHFGPSRPASPPASSYFGQIPSREGTPQPPPGAAEHFAYSTQLRRHTHDFQGHSRHGHGHGHSQGSLGTLSQLPYLNGGNLPLSELASSATEGAEALWRRAFRTVKGVGGSHEETVIEMGYAPGRGRSRSLTRGTDGEMRDTPSAQFAHCSVEDTIAHFQTSLTSGLSSSSVAALQDTHGYNEFSVSAPEPVLLKFAKTIYESPLILLLCGSAIISAVMGNVDDAVSITVAVLIVLTVGFIQEQRSEKSLEALNKLVPHHCHVIRDGRSVHVLANELVPGDVVTLTTGDRVPADLRLASSIDLEIDESSLTGETRARRKDPATCDFEHDGSADGGQQPVALADRSCVAYMGTLVRNGRGVGVVIATGTQTEFGVIFTMMQDVEEKRTPLQLSMDELAKKLSIISFGIIGLICIVGVVQQRPWLDMFTIGVSLAVAAIPEGLPIVTTVTLALGVLRMSKRKAIVKKLHSVEALGSVSVICSDKTGTLTMNEQTVTEIHVIDDTIHLDTANTPVPSEKRLMPAVRKALEVGSLCNNASAAKNEHGVFMGQSTDVALINVLAHFGMPDLRQTFTRLSERPFNSEQKYMAVSGIHSYSEALYSGTPREMYYLKGALDAVLARCKFYYVADGSTPPLDSVVAARIASEATATASRGLRIIALAYGYGSVESAGPDTPGTGGAGAGAGGGNWEDPEKNNLVFVGFQAMLDPPRRGVAESIGLLQSGGVQVVMITGDAEHTALAIARKLGLRVGSGAYQHAQGYGGGQQRQGGGNPACLTGKEIDGMTQAQLVERVGGVSVFARTTPRHKMAIVEAFQKRGAIVAMTGDGVNDAPALKMADIGVSMGKSGTDVAKEAADMILVDDNFSTILPAVEEGKSIFHNIQNFLSFQLSTAAAALVLISLSTVFGYSNPLNAMQILFINILMDGPPSQSLGVDPVDPAVMRRPPRKKDEPIITTRLLYRVLFSATTIVLGTLFIYTVALGDELVSRREQTMTFTCFVFLDLVSAVQNRGLGCGLTQNRMLVTTVSVSFVTQLALVYVPFMQAIFQTEALGARDLTTLALLALTSFALHEVRRHYERGVNEKIGYGSVVDEMA